MGVNIAAIETRAPERSGAGTTAPAAVATMPVAAPAAEPRDTVRADVIPASPPPEVLDAIDAAGRAYEALARAGRHISFGFDAEGRVQVELQDRANGSITRLSAADALHAAEGGGLT